MVSRSTGIIPTFVVTGITIPPLVAVMPKQYITPMETIIKGFDTYLDDVEGKTGPGAGVLD
jgi:hypothetical protein